MDTDIERCMRTFGFDISERRGSFERIAVTREQIKKDKVPHNPDEATRAKMRYDSQTSRFLTKYRKLYAVELDVLPARIPDVFRQQLVIDKVEKYYNKKVQQELLDQYSPIYCNWLMPF
jgi:hypothetical protein